MAMDEKMNMRVTAFSERECERLLMVAREHAIRVGADDTMMESRELLSIISTVISSLTISTYDWLRESGGPEAGGEWLASTFKHTTDHMKRPEDDIEIRIIRKGT